MISKAALPRWFSEQPLTGLLAFVCMMAAVAIPTGARLAAGPSVVGCDFTPYLPFIVLAAILMRWWQASLVALACATVADELFVGPPNALLDGACAIFGDSFFLATSVLIIGFVELVRRAGAEVYGPSVPGEGQRGIVFSLEGGQAWVNWQGSGAPVRLGSQTEVAEMMKDFLAQLEVGRRLAGDLH